MARSILDSTYMYHFRRPLVDIVHSFSFACFHKYCPLYVCNLVGMTMSDFTILNFIIHICMYGRIATANSTTPRYFTFSFVWFGKFIVFINNTFFTFCSARIHYFNINMYTNKYVTTSLRIGQCRIWIHFMTPRTLCFLKLINTMLILNPLNLCKWIILNFVQVNNFRGLKFVHMHICAKAHLCICNGANEKNGKN